MPYTSATTSGLYQAAKAALEADERFFVARIYEDAEQGGFALGTVPVSMMVRPTAAACLAAIEDAGWRLEQVTAVGPANGREHIVAVFRADRR